MFMHWPLAKSFPVGDNGMVAAKHPLAAQAGVRILQEDGSAVDAAIATSFASGVVEPYMSGLGGGGLALYQPVDGPARALHFGMRAPASARPDMYEVLPGTEDQDLFGWPRTRDDANISGPSSIALPGLVSGLYRLWELGGRLPWPDLIAPAIALASGGFKVDWLTSLRILQGQNLLSRFPASRSVFLSRGRPPLPDLTLGAEVLRQPDLARTLQAVADDPAALETGSIAHAVALAADRRFSVEELRRHKPLEHEPLSVEFRRAEALLAPGATGGPTVVEWLGILRELNPPDDETHPDLWFAIVRAGQAAMHDRLERLADPDFVAFPSEFLDPVYHRQMAEAIRLGEVNPRAVPPAAGSTSHLATVDAQGNVLTLTQTLLSIWGSGVVADGTGICLNNGMMWFDPEPGRANSVEGSKLPLANMCPVMVTKGGVPYVVYGASGGRRILGAVVQILVRVVMLGQSLAEAVAAPRLEISGHTILADVRFGQDFADTLSRRLGEPVVLQEPALGAAPWASPVGLMRLDDGSWTGGADPYSMACIAQA
jgi:gamma-glutamyltranspeptidase/glutathione hydrolase